MEKIRGRRHRATLQNYKAPWTLLLTNEKAKSTFTWRLLRPPTWALTVLFTWHLIFWATFFEVWGKNQDIVPLFTWHLFCATLFRFHGRISVCIYIYSSFVKQIKLFWVLTSSLTIFLDTKKNLIFLEKKKFVANLSHNEMSFGHFNSSFYHVI